MLCFCPHSFIRMLKNNFEESDPNGSHTAERYRDYIGEIMPNWHLIRFDESDHENPLPVRHFDGVFLHDGDYALVHSKKYYYMVQPKNGTKPSLYFTMQPLPSDAGMYGASAEYEELYSATLQHYAARLAEMDDLDKLIQSCVKEGYECGRLVRSSITEGYEYGLPNLMDLSRWLSDRFYGVFQLKMVSDYERARRRG